jgi:hypothetical protein
VFNDGIVRFTFWQPDPEFEVRMGIHMSEQRHIVAYLECVQARLASHKKMLSLREIPSAGRDASQVSPILFL